ncbi:MAG: pentapeptide repeat-containing protein, partial [Acidobacteriaceae bacterium]|nr:pentapeptide repeat-containing protein [Acidobacteriaceae bacterium]
FTEAQMQGADFHEAVLTAANLSGAIIRSDSTGNATTFYRAFLQGTNLAGAQFNDPTTLTSALVDFRPDGNNINILLDGQNHNQFACHDCTPPTGRNVCVFVNYPNPTRFPDSATKLACPDPGVYGACGPQDPDGSNPKWKSDITDLANPPTGVPPAWYENDSTYIKSPADPHSVCNGEAPIIFW